MFNLPVFVSDIDDDNVAKQRPPQATPVFIPAYNVHRAETAVLENVSIGDLRKTFGKLQPSKWKTEHYVALGLEFANDLELSEIVPEAQLPPQAWEAATETDAVKDSKENEGKYLAPKLANGLTLPGRNEFSLRCKELTCSREEASDALARRKIRTGRDVKLLHFRKFWISLDTVSRYWDTSKDDFRPTDCTRQDISKSTTISVDKASEPVTSRLHEEFHSLTENALQTDAANDYYGVRRSTGREMPNSHRSDLVFNFIEPIVRIVGCHCARSRASDRFPMDNKRFVQLQKVHIKLNVSGLIYKIPDNQQLAREGWNEGPILAVSARSTIDFADACPEQDKFGRAGLAKPPLVSEDDAVIWPSTFTSTVGRLDDCDQGRKLGSMAKCESKSIIDVSQEIGALLMIAQHRHRNATSRDEPQIGQGKWWVESPRFGGRLSGDSNTDEIPPSRDIKSKSTDEEGDTMEIQGCAKLIRRSMDTAVHSNDLNSKEVISGLKNEIDSGRRFLKGRRAVPRRELDEINLSCKQEILKKSRVLQWAPPKPVWDVKTRYSPIGKGPKQEYDRVYLVSSLFHHISLLCMRVHPAMLDILQQDDKDNLRISDLMPLEQYGLRVSRSRWFDLLKPEDRTEAFRAIWGALTYMMRDTRSDTAA